MSNTKLIAIYARVSTANQEEEQTIQNQIGVMHDHAKDNGHVIVKEYLDEGWSGDTLKRPALDGLRQDAKSNMWQGVLIYDPDRLARRYSYQELVIDELRETGIEVMFVTVAAPKNSEDKILYGVRGLFAEYERAKITERFRLGKLRKVKEGHILVSEALYGYTYVPKKEHVHGYYVINEEEASVVRLIFSLVANDGFTARKVTVRLQELGIKPRKSKRGVWNTSTLTTLLRHRGFIGEGKWGSTTAVAPKKPLKTDGYKRVTKSSRIVKPKDEWFIIPIPPILDEELFNRAQQQLAINSRLSQRNKKNEYLLAAKIRCTCGEARAGEGPQHGKHLYYRCADRVSRYPLPRTCFERAVNARIADRLVWDELIALMTSPQLLNQQIEHWLNSKRDEAVSVVNDVEPLMKEIGKLKEERARYTRAYGKGLFTLEQLEEYSEPVQVRIAKLEAQILAGREAERRLETLNLPGQAEIKSFAAEVATGLADLSFVERQGIVRSVIDKVVGNQEKLVVSGYIPIENINVKINDRHGMNTARHFDGRVNEKKIPFQFIIALKPESTDDKNS
jgi:site-specific DNA recombinase